MKKELLDKFKHALLTKEQKAMVIGGTIPCQIVGEQDPTCSCSRNSVTGCETVTCTNGWTGSPNCSFAPDYDGDVAGQL